MLVRNQGYLRERLGMRRNKHWRDEQKGVVAGELMVERTGLAHGAGNGKAKTLLSNAGAALDHYVGAESNGHSAAEVFRMQAFFDLTEPAACLT